MSEVRLPRLAYVGDVPVESSYHGSALLYRLLQGYPPNRLRILEGNLYQGSLAERRLPGVVYQRVHFGRARLLQSRLHRWYSLWLSLSSTSRTRAVSALLDDFAPEAVLTVGHGHLWVAAAEFAMKNRLPLHLIIHDDWPSMANLPRLVGDRVDRQFGLVYRSAASRLCVSPFMVAEYRQRYGVEGQVLYPAGSRDAQTFTAPPERLKDVGRGMSFAFAGTINMPDYGRLLRTLAECLEPLGGRVFIFGPLTAIEATSLGLNKPNVQLCGLLNSGQLIARLRADVDALFVPMSFADSDRPNMELGFPSKLVDYTAVGIPLLIMGPPYCSAVRWAHENPGVAEIVDCDDNGLLRLAIQRLSDDPEHRMDLAVRALSAGTRFFTHATAQSGLFAALLQPSHAA